MNVLIAQPKNKDTLNFIGVINGQHISEVLVCNRTFEEGKTYMIAFEEYEVINGAIVTNVTKMKEIN